MNIIQDEPTIHETAIDALRRFDIEEHDLRNWERELGLDIPVNIDGEKEYSPHHVNLFKNVKKHLTLGKTLDDIRKLVALPPLEESSRIKEKSPLS